MSIAEETTRARFGEQADRAFADWLQQPLVRMTLSQMPAGDNRDALRELLRSAFDAGNAAGQGMMALEVLHRMTEAERRR